MNRLHICFAVMALVFMRAAHADDSSQQMIEAPHVEKYLFVTVNEKNPNPFYFSVDSPGAVIESKPLTSGMTVTSAVGDGGGFNVVLGFLNPIEYSWSLSETAAEEPTYASAKSFAQSMNGLLATISPEVAKAPESRKAAYNMIQALSASTGVTVPVLGSQELYSSDLVEWLLWSDEKAACFDVSTQERKDALAVFLAAVTAADSGLFGGGEDSTDTVRQKAAEAISALKAASSVNDLRTQLTQASLVRAATMKAANKRARSTVEKVHSAVDGVKFTSAGKCPNFERYTRAAMARFGTTAQAILSTRERLADGLVKLNEDISDQLVNAGATPGDNYFRIGTVRVTNEQMKEVRLVIRRRSVTVSSAGTGEISVEDKGELTTTVRVRPHQAVVLEFAPGVVYTNMTYPRFGTAVAEGRTVVDEAGRERQNVSAVVMLNLIPNIKVFDTKALSWLVGQIGVGTAEKYPMLLAGGGIRVPSVNLAVTLGAAWAWGQELENLEVGQEISGTAQLERDITYRLQTRPAFYIGVQRGF